MLVQEYENQFEISERILDYQRELLERQDNKARTLLTILTLTSGIVALMTSLISETFGYTLLFFRILFILLSITYFTLFVAIICFSLRVLGPHVVPFREESKEWAPSISFYTGILSQKPNEYVSTIEEVTLKEKVRDNAKQIYIIAEILDYKIHNMNNALRLMPTVFFCFVLITILSLIISFNLLN